MIAESTRLQCMLTNYGILSQTPKEVEPVQIWPPGELVKVLTSMGQSRKLKLSGRPVRPLGSLGTSKLYRVAGNTVLCYPIIFSASQFYLSHDMELLTTDIKAELQFISKSWRLNGRPTFCIFITENDMKDPHFGVIIKFLAELRQGSIDGIKIRLGRIQNLVSSSCIEHLDSISGYEISTAAANAPVQELNTHSFGYQSLREVPKIPKIKEELTNFACQYNNTNTVDILEVLRNLPHIYGSIQLLGILLRREGPDFLLSPELRVKEKLERMHREAGTTRYWAALRYTSSLLQHLIDSICPYMTQIIVNGKKVTVGTQGIDFQEFSRPCTPQDIHEALYSKVQPYNIIGAVLQQELILYCGKLIATQPKLFDGILVLRMSLFERSVVSLVTEEIISVDISGPSRCSRASWILNMTRR